MQAIKKRKYSSFLSQPSPNVLILTLLLMGENSPIQDYYIVIEYLFHV